MLRGWTSIPQAVSKVWRIRGRIPTLNRFLWCGPHLFRRDTPLVANPKQPRVAKGEPLPYHRELKLTHDSQILDVLEEKLKQSSGKADSLICSDPKLRNFLKSGYGPTIFSYCS